MRRDRQGSVLYLGAWGAKCGSGLCHPCGVPSVGCVVQLAYMLYVAVPQSECQLGMLTTCISNNTGIPEDIGVPVHEGSKVNRFCLRGASQRTRSDA